jgi:hypothetical protein
MEARARKVAARAAVVVPEQEPEAAKVLVHSQISK